MKNYRLTLPIPLLFIAVIAGLFLHACGGSGGGDALSGDPLRYDPGIPAQVTGVQASSGDQVVTLSWTSIYEAESYNVYYAPATANGSAPAMAGVGAAAVGWTRITVNTSSCAVWGLSNNVTYFFVVTAANRDGEGSPSGPVASTPGPITLADLAGTWYFHTLVCGPSATWERGTLVVDAGGNASFTEFFDSAHYDPASDTSMPQSLPAGMVLAVQGDGSVVMSGAGAWPSFQGTMGSRKNMWVGTWTYSVDGSMALAIFQKKRAADDYNVLDVAGTGGGVTGNGPTRFAYHALNSGTGIGWEYSNARIGRQGQYWKNPAPPVTPFTPDGLNSVKDVIYWDYSTPTYKTLGGYDYLWKVTSFGVRYDGAVKEFNNFGLAALRDAAHNVIFTGRMTDDKTVIVGVSTKNAIDSSSTSIGAIQTISGQYYLRIVQLNFIPTDQSLPTYTVDDLTGVYKFHEIGSVVSGGTTQASWAYGRLRVDSSGVVTFPEWTDSNALLSNADTFSLAYYPDPGSGNESFTTFANFTTPNTGAGARYAGSPTAYTWWNGITNGVQGGAGVAAIPLAATYYNEHATLSYNKDLLVMTRTDSFGYSMVIGLK